MMKYKGCGTTTMIKNKRKPPPPPPAKSYFLSISITSKKSKAFSESTPKVRIKIPKLLAKMTAVKKKKNKNHHSNNGDQHKLSVHRKKIVSPIKVASLFSNVISGKKSSSCVPIRKVKYSCKNNGTECKSGGLVIGDKNKVLMKTAVEESTLVTSKSSVISLKSPPSSLKIGRVKDMVLEKENSKRPGSITIFKLHSRMKLSFQGLLNRRTGLKLTRGERNAARCTGNGSDHNSTVRDIKNGRLLSPVIRASEEEGNDCQELCKKRILLGKRCRPMNFGGILQ